jgi:GxxExxY protein
VASKVVSNPMDALTYKIIGHAMAVHRALGPGYREGTYQRDLETHLAAGGLSFVPEKNIEIYDSLDATTLIGYYIPDLIVEEAVVVELKALSGGLDNTHVAQVIGYLAVTVCTVGLLLNFGARSLQWKRIFPPKDVAAHRVNRQWLFVPDWLKAEREG